MNITGGKYNSISIKTADYQNIKPTLSKIRQAVFNTISSLGEYKTFCDLFVGSGIMTFEALSREFDVTSVEIDRKSTKIIQENAKKINEIFDLFNVDALKFLEKTDKKFDIIYIDPPYNSGLYEKVLERINKNNILNENGIVILEKPFSLKTEINDFILIKEKVYSDKSICYLRLRNKEIS